MGATEVADGEDGAVVVLGLLGGMSTRAAVVEATSRRAVDAAVAAGRIHVVARGRLALPEVEGDRLAAHRLSGRLCLLSAAQDWGWSVRVRPRRPQVVVPRNRKIRLGPAGLRADLGVDLHRADLQADDVEGLATSRDRTLVDCLRSLPFADALAVADSALRDGFSHRRLQALARDCRGPGSRQVRRVAAVADGRAANGFESALRAICLDVDDLNVRPQVPLFGSGRFLGRPDLVDEDLRLVIEADSFAWHGDRAALQRDARRYDAMVVHGWLVLRFSWEDVIHEVPWVEETLRSAVDRRTRRPCSSCGAA